MVENVELREKNQELEHTIDQLQFETETIGKLNWAWQGSLTFQGDIFKSICSGLHFHVPSAAGKAGPEVQGLVERRVD